MVEDHAVCARGKLDVVVLRVDDGFLAGFADHVTPPLVVVCGQ